MLFRDESEEYGPYSKVHKRQRRADVLQSPSVVLSQHNSLSTNSANRAAQEHARTHLRPSSVLESQRVAYDEKVVFENAFSVRFHEHRPDEGPARRAYDDRLGALRDRLTLTRPHRYEAALWDKFRHESIQALSEYYPSSTISKFYAACRG